MTTDIADRSHWEDINTGRQNDRRANQRGLRAWFSKTPARKILYSICDQFFSPDPGKKVLEVGCAPGLRLIEFAQRYAYQPYGVDYTQSGSDAVRTLFAKHNIPPNNCVHSDVFDQQYQHKYRQQFDVVISFGVIEHFTDMQPVIDAHLNLLKPGGRLMIMIPRLRGIYFPLTKWLAPDLIPKHNLSIMDIKAFRLLFDEKKVTRLYSGYYGVINMGMLQGHGRIQGIIVRTLQVAQTFLNPLLRHGHRFENRFTSPYLLFIGSKTSAS